MFAVSYLSPMFILIISASSDSACHRNNFLNTDIGGIIITFDDNCKLTANSFDRFFIDIPGLDSNKTHYCDKTNMSMYLQTLKTEPFFILKHLDQIDVYRPRHGNYTYLDPSKYLQFVRADFLLPLAQKRMENLSESMFLDHRTGQEMDRAHNGTMVGLMSHVILEGDNVVQIHQFDDRKHFVLVRRKKSDDIIYEYVMYFVLQELNRTNCQYKEMYYTNANTPILGIFYNKQGENPTTFFGASLIKYVIGNPDYQFTSDNFVKFLVESHMVSPPLENIRMYFFGFSGLFSAGIVIFFVGIVSTCICPGERKEMQRRRAKYGQESMWTMSKELQDYVAEGMSIVPENPVPENPGNNPTPDVAAKPEVAPVKPAEIPK